jgi:hypothetical protein
MNDAEKRSMAFAAASQAAEAVAELIRYAREGADHPEPFGEVEVIDKLLDAARMAIEVESGRVAFGDRLDVYSTICEHQQGWCG